MAVTEPMLERDTKDEARVLACQAFWGPAGAPLVEGNHVVLLEDARENYLTRWARVGSTNLNIASLRLGVIRS